MSFNVYCRVKDNPIQFKKISNNIISLKGKKED